MHEFSWPMAVALIAVAFMLVFRVQINALIARTKSVSATRDGFSTQGLEQQKAEAEASPAPAAGAVAVVSSEMISAEAHRLLMDIADSPALAEMVANFRNDLESKKLDLGTEAARVLLRYVAAATMWLGFEQAYLSIFGSQIQLLKALNQTRGISAVAIAARVEWAKSQHSGLATFTADSYLQYLVNHRLIFLDEHTWRLTPLGSEFLVWLVRQGRSEDKPY